MKGDSTDRQHAGGLKKCTEDTEMSQIVELGTPALPRGRQIKFTPERIQQIKNLVERGKTREEIAELIGVTLGSLQVTCSRLGISLRRPTLNNGTISLRRDEPHFNRVPTQCPSCSDSALELTRERLEQHSRPGPAEQAEAPTPCRAEDVAPWQVWGKRANEARAASFAIKMQYRGQERTTELPLTQDMIGHLAFEAAFRNVSIGELIDELIVAVVKRDLLQTVLERKEADEDR
jgi:hypothetical protein